MSEEQKHKGADDIFVPIGDLSGTPLAGVAIDENQELMVEDFITGFNQMVIQGLPPVKALFAFAQAFGLTLGYCLRCGLNPADGRKMLGMLIEESRKAAKTAAISTDTTVN